MAPNYPFLPLFLIISQASAILLAQSKVALNPKPIGGSYIPSCTDLNATYSRRCWDALNLTEFLTNPVHGWNATTPTCTDSTKPEDSCCEPTEGWATCFLRIASGVNDACYNRIPPQDQNCTFDVDISPRVKPDVAPQTRYILATIKNINFFLSYYASVVASDSMRTVYAFDWGSAASNTIVSNPLDPESDTILNIGSLNSALTFGLPFLSTLHFPPPRNANTTQELSNNLITSLESSPLTLAPLLSSGSVDSQKISINSVRGESFESEGYRINEAQEVLMNSIDAFVAFAKSGIWSESNQFVKTPLSDPLQAALRVYFFSETLRQNSWSAVHISTIDQPPLDNLQDFANLCSDSNLVENYNSSASYCNAKGVKGRALYLSPETGRVYRLDYKGDRKNKKVESIDLLRQIPDRKWADLPSLFDGSYNCTQKGLAGGAVVNQLTNNVTDASVIDMSCLSRLPIYLPCTTECPTSIRIDGKCPFGRDGSC